MDGNGGVDMEQSKTDIYKRCIALAKEFSPRIRILLGASPQSQSSPVDSMIVPLQQPQDDPKLMLRVDKRRDQQTG
jgi:hypothetical protein